MSSQIPRPPQRKSFSEQTLGDMVRSMVILALLVGLIVGIGALLSDEEERPVRAVDYSGQLSSARDLAEFPVLAPQGLGPGWVPTSVDLQSSSGTVRWHLGFLTPEQEYVGLEQGDFEPEGLVRQYVGDLRPRGRVQVDGEQWRLFRGDTDTALVRRHGRAVTIVVGTAGAEVLTEFAESLG